MKVRAQVPVLLMLLLPALVWAAEPVCEFKNAGRRRISGDNPEDFQCIKLRAEAGESGWQYYLGIILTGTVAGKQNIPEGIAVLEKLARKNDKVYSKQAMWLLGSVYKRPGEMQNHELAYQWIYLAATWPSVHELSSYYLPDKELDAVLSLERKKELEKVAPDLLRDR